MIATLEELGFPAGAVGWERDPAGPAVARHFPGETLVGVRYLTRHAAALETITVPRFDIPVNRPELIALRRLAKIA